MIWVVCRKEDYGYSGPLAAFDKLELAEIFAAGARMAYGTAYIFEMKLNDVEKCL